MTTDPHDMNDHAERQARKRLAEKGTPPMSKATQNAMDAEREADNGAARRARKKN